MTQTQSQNRQELLLVKILRFSAYLVAAVPLIIFSQYISPFHFGKVIVFRSLVEIALVFYLLLIWRDRSYLPKANTVFWSFLAFVGVFTLTTLTSVQIYESFWGTLERMGGLWSFWHYFVYFVILTSVMRTEKDWFNLFRFVVLVGILSAFYGFLQKTELSWVVGSGNRARIFGTIGNAALFAGYQVVAMFLALTLFFRPQNSFNQKYFFAAAAGINFIAVMMTVVRGSVLGTGVGLLVFALLYAWKYKSSMAKKILVGLVLFVISFAIFASLARDTEFVRSSGSLTRLTDFSLKSFTVQTRFWAWESGIEGWKHSPKTVLLGWGPENFNIPFSVNFNPKFYAGPGAETLFDRAHNMFVEVLVTMGIIGLLAYLVMFWTAFRALNFQFSIFPDRKAIEDPRQSRDNFQSNSNDKNSKQQTPTDRRFYGIGLTALLVAYMIHNAFIFDTSANFIVFFTVLGFISWLRSNQQPTPKESKHPTGQATNDVKSRGDHVVLRDQRLENVKKPKKALFNAAAMVMFIVVLVLIYKTNVIPTKANYASTRGIVAGWQNDFNGAAAKFREAINYDTFGKYEIRNRYAQYLFEYSSAKGLSPAVQEELKWNIEKVKEIAQARPMDYLPRLYISRMLIILGKDDRNSSYNDEALKYSLEALDVAPRFVRTYYEVAQAYLNKGEREEAIKYFQIAAELNPDAGISFWYWGVAEIQAGNAQRGVELVDLAIEKRYGPDEQDLTRLINIYIQLDDVSRLTKLYEQIVVINPNNPQYHASLAAAYVRLGRIDDAVFQAREAVRVDPSFEPDAREFLRTLGREL